MKKILIFLSLFGVFFFIPLSSAAEILSETHFATPEDYFCSDLVWTGTQYRTVWNEVNQDWTQNLIKTAVFDSNGYLTKDPVTILEIETEGNFISNPNLKLIYTGTYYALFWSEHWLYNSQHHFKLHVTVFDESNNIINENIISSYTDFTYDAIWDGYNLYVVWAENSIRVKGSSRAKFAKLDSLGNKIWFYDSSIGAIVNSKTIIPYDSESFSTISLVKIGKGRLGLVTCKDLYLISIYTLNSKGKLVKEKTIGDGIFGPTLRFKYPYFYLGYQEIVEQNIDENTIKLIHRYHIFKINFWSLQTVKSAAGDDVFHAMVNLDFIIDGNQLVFLWLGGDTLSDVGAYARVFNDQLIAVTNMELLIDSNTPSSLLKSNNSLTFINQLNGTGDYSDLYLIRFKKSSGFQE